MRSIKNCAKHAKAGALFLSGIAAFVLQIPPASAADFGMGVAFDASGNTVMVPIKMETMLIEPEIRFDTGTGTGSNSSSMSAGAGVYVRKGLGPLFESYTGGRVVYSTFKSTSGATDSKSNSFILAPTFGIQHFFSKQFSLGLDASLRYGNGKSTQTGQPDSHFHNWGTETRVLLRAFF